MQLQVLRFGGPALSTVLADPLMSVVDALCCGRFCSTLQLASLGPALAVFNFVNYFFFFLNAATTVEVTKSLACNNEDRAANTVSNALFIAATCGIALAAVLLIGAVPLVAATGCVAELIPAAVAYLRIRALAQPVVLSSMVVQAGLLAQQDSVTPLQAITLACAINVLGDLALVPTMGAVGAAWATLVSQLAALPLLLLLAARRNRIPVRLRRPRASELMPLLSASGPLFCFEMGLSTCCMRLAARTRSLAVHPS